MNDEYPEVWPASTMNIRLPDIYSSLNAKLHQRTAEDMLRRLSAYPSASAPVPVLADVKTAYLVMELLSRGFAVLKTPESGTPETLRSE